MGFGRDEERTSIKEKTPALAFAAVALLSNYALAINTGVRAKTVFFPDSVQSFTQNPPGRGHCRSLLQYTTQRLCCMSKLRTGHGTGVSELLRALRTKAGLGIV